MAAGVKDAAGVKEAKTLPGPPVWKLETAKAKFSEVVRLAKSERPQTVTYRGRREVVVLDAAEYDRLCAKSPKMPLVAFLEMLHMDGVDLAWDGAAPQDPGLLQSGPPGPGAEVS